MTRDLFASLSLSRSQLDVASSQFIPTIYLAFIRQDDFPPATGWVDGQGLLEALFNV